MQQQLQAARDEASALQQQLVDVRQHAQEQVKDLRASNATLHVSTFGKQLCWCNSCKQLASTQRCVLLQCRIAMHSPVPLHTHLPCARRLVLTA
jgi:hypothetical protein